MLTEAAMRGKSDDLQRTEGKRDRGPFDSAGTGLAYHEHRKNKAAQYHVMESEMTPSVDAGDVEEALKQALNI